MRRVRPTRKTHEMQQMHQHMHVQAQQFFFSFPVIVVHEK